MAANGPQEIAALGADELYERFIGASDKRKDVILTSILALTKGPGLRIEVPDLDTWVKTLYRHARDLLGEIEGSNDRQTRDKILKTKGVFLRGVKPNASREENLHLVYFCLKIVKFIPPGLRRVAAIETGRFGAHVFSGPAENIYLPTTHATAAPEPAPAAVAAAAAAGPRANIENDLNGYAVAPAAPVPAFPGILNRTERVTTEQSIVPFSTLQPIIIEIMRHVKPRILGKVGERWMTWLRRPDAPLLLRDVIPANLPLPRGLPTKLTLPILRIKLPRRKATRRKIRAPPPRRLLTNGRATPPPSPVPTPRATHTPPSTPEVMYLPNRNRTPPPSPVVAAEPPPPLLPFEDALVLAQLVEPVAVPAAPAANRQNTRRGRAGSNVPLLPPPPRNTTRKKGRSTLAVIAGAVAIGAALFLAGERGEPEPVPAVLPPILEVAVNATMLPRLQNALALVQVGTEPRNWSVSYGYRGEPFTYTEQRWQEPPPSTALVQTGTEPRNWGIGPAIDIRGLPFAPSPVVEGATVRSNQRVKKKYARENEAALNLNGPPPTTRATQFWEPPGEEEARVHTSAKAKATLARIARSLPNNMVERINLRNPAAGILDVQISNSPPSQAIRGEIVEDGGTYIYFGELSMPSSFGSMFPEYKHAIQLRFKASTTVRDFLDVITPLIREKSGYVYRLARSLQPNKLRIKGKLVIFTPDDMNKPLIDFIQGE